MPSTPVYIPGKRKKAYQDIEMSGYSSTPLSSQVATLNSSRSTSTAASTIKTVKHRRPRERRLSPLEKLPTELLQAIFLSSYNIYLPLSSPSLLRKLTSDRIFQRFALSVFHSDNKVRWPKDLSLLNRTRVVQSRFFTWEFCVKMVGQVLERERARVPESKLQKYRVPPGVCPRCIDVYHRIEGRLRACHGPDAEPGSPARMHWSLHRDPGTGLLDFRHFQLPAKLLRGPWTQEKIHLLEFCSLGEMNLGRRRLRNSLNNSSLETFESALFDAIAAESLDALKMLLCHYDVPPTKEMLRTAVCDHWHNPLISLTVVRWMRRHVLYGRDMSDCIDPAVWLWVDTEANGGDEYALEVRRYLCRLPWSSHYRARHGLAS